MLKIDEKYNLNEENIDNISERANEICQYKKVYCDGTQLERILINVLGNAIKYTPEGGSVFFNVEQADAAVKGTGRYVFTVQDTGIGMNEEYIKTIYEPFSREKTVTETKIEGTGLGMSIVKRLVDLMEGDIKIESEVGKGTKIVLTFDLVLMETADQCLEKKQDEPVRDFAGKKLLLVEDNEMNREIAEDILNDYGFVVTEAENGREAYEIIKNASTGDFDLILMDIQMPVMNGYEATRAIRELGTEVSEIPIIAMTANAFDEDKRTVLASGMNAHLAKPIDIDRLARVLSKFT